MPYNITCRIISYHILSCIISYHGVGKSWSGDLEDIISKLLSAPCRKPLESASPPTVHLR